MFSAAPAKRKPSAQVVRKVEMRMGEKTMKKLFPDAETLKTRKTLKRPNWRTSQSTIRFTVDSVRDCEEIFGKEFYCRSYDKNVVVLLGPLKYKLMKTTTCSYKGKLRMKRYQEDNDEITDLVTHSFSTLKIYFRSSLVSRVSGNKTGYWKKMLHLYLSKKIKNNKC